MYESTHFSRDATTVEFDTSVDGITTDADGETEFDWDSVERITVDDPPYTSAFDSKEFYKIPATVARPIPQPYQFGEDAVWLKKPREELKRAAWSLDNAPWTHGHPETGMVKDVSDIRGFWANPRYHDGLDDLDADLHIPVGDEDSREYVEDTTDVSVGFYNRIEKVDSYDGVIGGEDDANVDIDGYQTNMLFDHVASVEVGRCSGSQGCGIDAAHHGHTAAIDEESFIRGTVTTNISDDADGTVSTDTDDLDMSETDDPSGSQDCGCGSNENNDNHMQISFDDLSSEAAISKLESQHDGAKDRLDELRSYQDEAEVAEEAAEELDRDVSELADAVAMLSDRKEELENEVDNLQDTVSDLRRPEMEEDAEYIAEHTDRFGDSAEEVIDELDEDAEAIADKRELVEDLAETADEVTANAGGDGNTNPTETTDGGKYAATPWE